MFLVKAYLKIDFTLLVPNKVEFSPMVDVLYQKQALLTVYSKLCDKGKALDQ